ncbi:hypothetical protein [Micromonospora humi]|uniref:Uncharacterized protein n=1 Tax=Micromonospora humi TaxID=745366 RepID=A0A1C5IJL9_9ACTN|nr:hypothetical protein [Micromonospora humi]SCG58229.1 hypothetical protein GA0070213_10630 [Micromonospora humi]
MRPERAADRSLSIEVELVTGRGRTWWPRPGRVFAAGPAHTFAQLAGAVDRAFAYVFDLGADWTHLCTVRREHAGRPPALPALRDGWGDRPDQYGPGVGGGAACGVPPGLPPLLASWRPRRP